MGTRTCPLFNLTKEVQDMAYYTWKDECGRERNLEQVDREIMEHVGLDEESLTRYIESEYLSPWHDFLVEAGFMMLMAKGGSSIGREHIDWAKDKIEEEQSKELIEWAFTRWTFSAWR